MEKAIEALIVQMQKNQKETSSVLEALILEQKGNRDLGKGIDALIMQSKKNTETLAKNLEKLESKKEKIDLEPIKDILTTEWKEVNTVLTDIRDRYYQRLAELEKADKKTDANLEKLRKELSDSIKVIADRKLPELPVDKLWESIDDVKKSIPKPIVAKDIKDKLESLEGDERLSASAIKDLEDRIESEVDMRYRMPTTGGRSVTSLTELDDVDVSGLTLTNGKYVLGSGSGGSGSGDMTAAVYDPASITEQLVGLTASQTLTNKSIDVDNNTITNAGNLDVARTAGSTYSTIQHIQDLFHSAGWTSGGVITSNGDGTCAVTAGTGLIRATDSDIDTIYFTDFAANASLALVNNDVNYIYVEYNAGSPQVVSTTTARTDYNTNFIIGEIYRDGTTLHINQTVKSAVSDHAGKMIRFNQEVMPYAHVSGGAISETGTRNIAITAGAFWEGLIRFSTNSFDSSAAGTFVYYYRDGVGGWTAVSSSTQIDNTQYDNNTGTLATLTNNRYGVHWVYLGTDSHVYVVYGRGDYLLTQAQDAMPPSDLPDVISSHGFLVGKIIIQKNASTFTQIESAFMTMFIPSIASEHNSLSGLQGGTSDEYYHLTSAEYSALTIATPTTYTPSGTTQTITFADNDRLAILDLGSATGDVTLTINGMVAGNDYLIKTIQGATARNLIFPASVIGAELLTAWDTSTNTLTLTATNDAKDVVGLTYDGTDTLLTAEFNLS